MRALLPLLMAVVSLTTVAACKPPPPAEAETPAVATPDPDAPAPGTQAAEAIGMDAAPSGSGRP